MYRHINISYFVVRIEPTFLSFLTCTTHAILLYQGLKDMLEQCWHFKHENLIKAKSSPFKDRMKIQRLFLPCHIISFCTVGIGWPLRNLCTETKFRSTNYIVNKCLIGVVSLHGQTTELALGFSWAFLCCIHASPICLFSAFIIRFQQNRHNQNAFLNANQKMSKFYYSIFYVKYLCF